MGGRRARQTSWSSRARRSSVFIRSAETAETALTASRRAWRSALSEGSVPTISDARPVWLSLPSVRQSLAGEVLYRGAASPSFAERPRQRLVTGADATHPMVLIRQLTE